MFGLWSTGVAQASFVETLRAVFPRVETHAVEFFNPLDDRDEVNTIYLAHAPATAPVPRAEAPRPPVRG